MFITSLLLELFQMATSSSTTSVAGTISSALASSVTSSVSTGSAGSGTLAGLILNLRTATKAPTITAICDQIVRTSGLPAGAIDAAEQLAEANLLTDATARWEGIQDGINRLQALNTAASQQLGVLSSLLSKIGL
jgi:hypothetical protein